MTVELAIPRKDSEPLMIPMEQGENLFVLGANGTGKSGLMQYLYAQSSRGCRQSGSVMIS